MATRREAREWVLQILFRLDMNPEEDLDAVFRDFWAEQKSDRKAQEFTESIARGVRQHLSTIDAMIRQYAEHWDIKRMGIVDRNVMRMAIYEMLECPDIPRVVSINEAVDIAKYFSSGESGRFVNGILDRIRKELEQHAGDKGRRPSGDRNPA